MKRNFYEVSKDISKSLFAEEQCEYNCTLHFHRAFEVSYIHSGASRYEVEGNVFVAECDDIFFSHCYYSHKTYDDLPNKKYVIAVPLNLSTEIDAMFRKTTLPELCQDKEFNKTLLPYFEILVNQSAEMPEIVVKGYLYLIFGLLRRHYGDVKIKKQSKNVSLISDILNYIDAHCQENISLSSIAKSLGYNKSYLSRTFNNSIGISFSDYLNGVRLDRFKKLQKEKIGCSITELVFSAGFQSLATFYRVYASAK